VVYFTMLIGGNEENHQAGQHTDRDSNRNTIRVRREDSVVVEKMWSGLFECKEIKIPLREHSDRSLALLRGATYQQEICIR
jgi:hypothetical protein